ncbi:MAG: hypothetical protein ACOYXA_00445 [Bacteroidota bacterium]
MKNKPSLRWLVVIPMSTSLLQAQPPQKWITLYTDNFSGNHYDLVWVATTMNIVPYPVLAWYTPCVCLPV